LTPVGSGVEQVNVTAPLNPPEGVTVKVKSADWPRDTDAEEAGVETAKSGAATASVTAADTLGRLFASPP
jgi:hypothetical protein